MTRAQIIIIGLGVVLIVASILILTGIIPGLRTDNKLIPIKLEVWGVFDTQSQISATFDAYQKARPNVTISYRQFPPDTYEKELIDALAAGHGPDVFMIQNSWLPKHYAKLVSPDPKQFNLTKLQELFPRVVEQDFAPDGTVYALPLYIDTLALIYNKDIFDKKGIALPPKDWVEFQNITAKIRDIDKRGNITLAAGAIGGSAKSINRAPDLLSALMLQSGTEMTSSGFDRATFNDASGQDALNFYTKFADVKNNYYTWNDDIHYSLDAFAEGGVAMIFNYQYNLRTLRDKNPFLRIGVSALPQINTSSRIDYPNYFGLGVSRQSKNAGYAWDFIIFETTNPDISKRYLSATGHPPALRTLINEKLTSPEMGVFANAALSARSWPQADNVAIDSIFSDMIESVISGRFDIRAAINQGAADVTEIMRRR